jgi:hypothetical protein
MDKDTTPTYFIALRGKSNIPVPLEIGKNYAIEVKGSVTQKKEDDNFDGSSNICWKFEPVEVVIKDELGTTIRAKDPRKNSQKFRSYLFKLYSDEGVTEDFDAVYDAVTLEAMTIMPALLRAALKRLQK